MRLSEQTRYQILSDHYDWHMPLSRIDYELALPRGTARRVIVDTFGETWRDVKKLLGDRKGKK